MGALGDLLELPGWRAGVAVGAVGGAALLIARATKHRPVPLAGLIAWIATVIAVAQSDGASLVRPILAGAIVLVLLHLSDRAWAFAAALGAVVISVDSNGLAATERWLLVAGTAASIALVMSGLRREPDTLSLPLLAPVALACYATLPDTEMAAALLGALVAIATISWPYGANRCDAPGAAAAMSLTAWIASVEGRGRPTSTIGVAVALLVMSLVRPPRPHWLHQMAAITLATIGCLVAARWVGITPDQGSALTRGAITSAGALLVHLGWRLPRSAGARRAASS